MFHSSTLRCALFIAVLAAAPAARGAFDLQLTISPTALFNATQRAKLTAALATAEALWERVVTGYQPGISVTTLPIIVGSNNSIGLAQGGSTDTTTQGGFVVATAGQLQVNPASVDNLVSWAGYPNHPNPPPQFLGVNYLDDLLAHEIGHAMGIGFLWTSNGVYNASANPFRYTGANGVAAYRREFDPLATFVPVEDANLPGTQHSHWNQRMRSAPAPEGDPTYPNYWYLDPRVGITDSQGRDLGLELMTGALDPDWGEPFLSLTTIYSLRDLGYSTVPEPGTAGLLALGVAMIGPRRPRARS